jgi:hypothetical protein
VRRLRERQKRRSENNSEISLHKSCARVWTEFLWRRIGPSGFHASRGGGGCAITLSRTTLLLGIGLSASCMWRLGILCCIGLKFSNESISQTSWQKGVLTSVICGLVMMLFVTIVINPQISVVITNTDSVSVTNYVP